MPSGSPPSACTHWLRPSADFSPASVSQIINASLSVAFLAPVAFNRTVEGQERRNRRVEQVEL